MNCFRHKSLIKYDRTKDIVSLSRRTYIYYLSSPSYKTGSVSMSLKFGELLACREILNLHIGKGPKNKTKKVSIHLKYMECARNSSKSTRNKGT